MSRRLYHGSDGAPVHVGKRVGKGGEGEVLEVAGRPALVAKIYATAPSAERVGKLRAMVSRASPVLERIAAWPVGLLHDGPGGPVVGFLMPRLSGHSELHRLSHPTDRLKHHPEVGYDFLVHVAANIARGFDTLHESGLVVGDVNESVVMVHPDGTVMFIDCDSMQFSDGGTTWTCDVAKPEFQPPELLESHTSFRGLPRTVDHDAFGLGVLLFQLLFLGWHPFAVRMLQGDQQPVPDNIRAGRFPHALGFKSREFDKPPHALDANVFPDVIRDLFERTFMRGKSRPSPREWVRALERLAGESLVCTRYATHFFHPVAGRCPFCELDTRLGFAILPHIAYDAVKLREVWAELQSLWFELNASTPPPEVPMPEPPEVPHELVASADDAVRTTRWQLFAAAVGLVAVFFWWPLGAIAIVAVPLEWALARRRPEAWRQLRTSLRASRAAFIAAELELAAPVDAAVAHNYEDARQAFERLLHHDDFRQAEVRALQQRHDSGRLQQWLQQQRIRPQTIASAPGASVAALEARGLRTAADVARLKAPGGQQGLDPAVVQALLRWEYGLRQRWQSDPDEPALARAIEALQQRLDVEHAQLMQRLVLASEWLLQRRPADRQRRSEAEKAWTRAFLDLARDEALWAVAGRRVDGGAFRRARRQE